MNILFIYFRKINKILEINKDDFCDKLEGWEGGGRWEGGSKGKRNQNNIVKQLSSN